MAPLSYHSEYVATTAEHVRESMTPAPCTVSPETSVREAQRLMQHHRVDHLPVCEDGRLVGLVTDRDLLRVSASPATSLAVYELHYLLERLSVADIMSRFPVTIGPDHLVTEAAKRMLSHKIDALPVTENKRLVGMLTWTHVLRAFMRSHVEQSLAA